MVLESNETNAPPAATAEPAGAEGPASGAQAAGAGTATSAELTAAEADQAEGFSKDKEVDGSQQPCPGQNQSTIEAKWSRAEVVPFNNSLAPIKPPLASAPVEAKVRMEVKTTNVPPGTEAEITVRHCYTGAYVANGTLKGLVVKGDKVVDPATGEAPVWFFDADTLLWDPWDRPFYFFTVSLDYKSLQKDTPRDYRKREAECLRLKYWHVAVADARADANDRLTTVKEIGDLAKLVATDSHHEVLQHAFNKAGVSAAEVGARLRNAYIYHQASHGRVEHRATGTQAHYRHGRPRGNSTVPPEWRSVVRLGGTSIGDTEITLQVDSRIAPKCLAYFNCCLAGWEPSLARAFLTRGTRYVVAFRRKIADIYARDMMEDFYELWCKTYKHEPRKVPSAFYATAAPYAEDMMPVLYGDALEASSNICDAADAVNGFFNGAANPISSSAA